MHASGRIVQANADESSGGMSSVRVRTSFSTFAVPPFAGIRVDDQREVVVEAADEFVRVHGKLLPILH